MTELLTGITTVFVIAGIVLLIGMIHSAKKADQEDSFISSKELNDMREESKDHEFIAYIAKLKGETDAFELEEGEPEDALFNAMQDVTEMTDAEDLKELEKWE